MALHQNINELDKRLVSLESTGREANGTPMIQSICTIKDNLEVWLPGSLFQYYVHTLQKIVVDQGSQ